jgi:hypothetical protein
LEDDDENKTSLGDESEEKLDEPTEFGETALADEPPAYEAS